MDQKIMAYAKGELNIEKPEITFPAEKITGEVVEGGSRIDEITIRSGNGIPMNGNIEVFDHRIHLVDGEFGGTSYTVKYEVRAHHIEEGDQVEGVFHLMTNGGEYDLPYCYDVVKPYVTTNAGRISSLAQFCEYAKDNWEEAVKIFQQDTFPSVFCREIPAQRIYQTLIESRFAEQAMEEFFIWSRLKEPVNLHAVNPKIPVIYDQEDVAKNLVVDKTSWGYVEAEICCEEEGVYLAKTHITKDDFLGKSCEIPIVIEIDKLRDASVTIPVIVKTVYEELVFTLYIEKKNKKKAELPVTNIVLSSGHLKKTYQKQLMKDYLAFRVNKMTLKEYTDRSIECANELMKFDHQASWYRLIRLHMYIMRKEHHRITQEFEAIEEHKDKMLTDVLSRCYYGYLRALYTRDEAEIAKTIKMIRNSRKQCSDSFFLVWMLVYLDENYMEDKSLMYEEFVRVHKEGNNSPMLYYEVCELYNEYPAMLKQLNSLELYSVAWGLKRHFLNDEVRERFIELAASVHRYDDKLYRMLDYLYQEHPEENLLQVICALLIKGNKIEQKYHHYYALGVEDSLKIIGLMENYMKSLDRSNYPLLPQQLVLYFTYEDHCMSDREMAYLYANIVVNKATYGTSFAMYFDNMRRFLVEQVEKGNMNDDLAVIYKEFFTDTELAADVAAHLPNVIFKHKIVCDNSNITGVLVGHDEVTTKEFVPLHHGHAYVDLLTDDTVITLVDQNQNRYVDSIPYEVYPIIEAEKFLAFAYAAKPEEIRVLLKLGYLAEKNDLLDYETIKVYKSLLEQDVLQSGYRKRLNGYILEYYYSQYEGNIFEEYLMSLNVDDLDEENRRKAITYMIDRELYEQAFYAISQFLDYPLDEDDILKLCTYFFEAEEVSYNEQLLTMAFELFHRSHYNEAVIRYLMKYAKGCMRELTGIFKVAKDCEFDTGELAERIVLQSIQSDVYDKGVMEAFKIYVRKKPNRFVCEAFLKILAYQYFMEQKPIVETAWEIFIWAYKDGRLEDDLCQAALLYAMANHIKWAQEHLDVLESVMKHFVKKDMLFPFMQQFESLIELPKEMYIKTFLVYRSKPGSEVFVHYYVKSHRRPEYHTEPMREYFNGYYCKDFVLFSDEQLEYYVTDGEGDSEIRVESDKLPLHTYLKEHYDSRFEMINDLLKMKEQDSHRYKELLELYIKDVYLIDTNMILL